MICAANQPKASTGSVVNPFRYTARESDPETGPCYYRARYYDSNEGRFLSEDPTGFRGGLDYYRYVRNNAVNRSDPTGLYSVQGFTPGDATQMILTIKHLVDKLQGGWPSENA